MIRDAARAFVGLVILLYCVAVVQQLDEANEQTETWGQQ